MKRNLLTISIAAALFSTSAMADSGSHADMNFLAEGVQVKTIDHNEGATVTTPLHERQWTLQGVPDDVDVADINTQADPREIAHKTIQRVRSSGYLNYYVKVDPDNNLINFVAADTHITGPFAAYMPSEITSQALGERMPLIRRAADAYNSVPKIDIGQVKDGILPVDVALREKEKRFSSGVTLSSFGSRYAATDTASVFTYGSIMDGLLAKASYSYGLSDTRSESEGGGYHGLSLSLEHPTPYGIFAFNYRYSDSKQGGIYVPLDMNQTVHISDFQYIMPTVWGEYNAGIKHVDQSMEMKAIDLEASQDYQAVFAGLDYKKHFTTGKPEFWSQINVSNTLTYGLNQNTDGILYGLPADDNWIKYELKVNYDQRIHDFTLSSGFGLQFSDSDNLPNHEEFSVGGPKRGNSYYPGIASTSEGWFAHTRLYTKPIAYSFKNGLSGLTVTPFVGLNYSTGDDLAGVKQEAKSAEMGIKLNLSNKLVGELGYSKSIDNRFNVDYDDRLMFNLSYLF